MTLTPLKRAYKILENEMYLSFATQGGVSYKRAIVTMYNKRRVFIKADQTDPDFWGDEWKDELLYSGDGACRFYKIQTRNIFIPSENDDTRQEVPMNALKEYISKHDPATLKN